jgi:hypothetical protein
MIQKVHQKKVNVDGWLFDEHIASYSNASRRVNELIQKGIMYELEKQKSPFHDCIAGVSYLEVYNDFIQRVSMVTYS